MNRRGRFAGRDQAVSEFAATLGRLCDALPADAAALVDAEGETVDYAGVLTPYDIKVAAAEWQLVLSGLHEDDVRLTRPLDELTVRANYATFMAFAISEGYALVLQLPRRAFYVSQRAISEAIRELCREACLTLPERYAVERCYQVDVREDRPDCRPQALWLDQSWEKAEVIGRVNGPPATRGERAYRIMLDSGYETTLVRERLGRWYRQDDL